MIYEAWRAHATQMCPTQSPSKSSEKFFSKIKNSMNRIEKLSEATINRIAAGEIIVSPCFAIKELVENSIDAGSTQITVSFASLSDFTITDNGHGIGFDDLEIVCARFTTSKLQHYNDLERIQTFGFRGEALASVSHVSRLAITTKIAGSPIAMKCEYIDGKMESKKPVAGNQGTIIAVKDLFYNSKTRLQCLNLKKEYQNVLDIVQKYAIQYPNLSFCCKHKKVDFISSGSQKELMSRLYKGHYKEFEVDDFFKAKGLIGPGKELILFVNNRLVEMPSLKKAIDNTVFVSILVDPKNVDVNVHPSKSRVHLMNEDSIIKTLVDTINNTSVEESREFYVQSKVSLAPVKTFHSSGTMSRSNSIRPSNVVRVDPKQKSLDQFIGVNENGQKILGKKGELSNASIAVPFVTNEPNNSCRTLPESQESGVCQDVLLLSSEDEADSNQPQDGDISRYSVLRQFEAQHGTSDTSRKTIPIPADPITARIRISPFLPTDENEQYLDLPRPVLDSRIKTSEQVLPKERKRQLSDCELQAQSKFQLLENEETQPIEEHDMRTWIEVNLYSIHELGQEIESRSDDTVSQVFANHVLVGIINARSVLIQHETKLLMIDYYAISKELFYQLTIRGFSNFGILWTDPVRLQDLLDIHLNTIVSDGPEDDLNVIKTVVVLIENRSMLKEYFSIIIQEDGTMTGLPNIIDGYFLETSKLPKFVYQMVNHVNWKQEMACFKDISCNLAEMYSISSEYEIESRTRIVGDALMYLKAPSDWVDTEIRQLAELNDLYKIFERC